MPYALTTYNKRDVLIDTESKKQLIQNIDGEIYPAARNRMPTLMLYGNEGEEITVTPNSTIIFGARRGLLRKNHLWLFLSNSMTFIPPFDGVFSLKGPPE